MVKNLRVVFRKGSGSEPIPNENGKASMWKKKSCSYPATVERRKRKDWLTTGQKKRSLVYALIVTNSAWP
jgi:hypothetical protein